MTSKQRLFTFAVLIGGIIMCMVFGDLDTRDFTWSGLFVFYLIFASLLELRIIELELEVEELRDN